MRTIQSKTGFSSILRARRGGESISPVGFSLPLVRSEGALAEVARSFTRLFSRNPGVAVPPHLSDPVRYPFGQFEVQIGASCGQEFLIQTTRDFKSWESLETITANREKMTFTDKSAERYGALFYRAISGEFVSNCVGFLTIEIPPGFSMIANPLHGPSNTVADLLSTMPEKTSLSRFNQVTFSLSENLFRHNKWSRPDEKLVPGEGALIFNPTQVPIKTTFVGEVAVHAPHMPIHQGTTIRSSMYPIAGRLDTDLGFPISPGDVVSVYSNHQECYVDYPCDEKGWRSGPPLIRLGEAFWIAKNVAGSWSQHLPVPH